VIGLAQALNNTSNHAVTSYFESQAVVLDEWKRRNWYYHAVVTELVKFLVPEGQSVLEVGSGTGDLLAALKPSRGTGIDASDYMVQICREKYLEMDWRKGDAENLHIEDHFDYVVLSDLVGYLRDVEMAFSRLNSVCDSRSRIIITQYNYLWEPLLQLAQALKLKAPVPIQNWLSPADVENMLYLAGFEVIKKGNKLLFPKHIPLLSRFLNKFVANLPVMRHLGVLQYYVARPIATEPREFSVSVVIPCRNEKENIEQAILRLPEFGTSLEIIFVEGHSTDGTLDEVKRVAELYGRQKNIRWAVQDGKGKGDAVRKGFAMASGDILMILDADLTVAPEDLPKFYDAMRLGKGDFINGSRLVYPMEREAMRFFNVLGNKFFSAMFTWLLGQRIKDTLCGTKVLFRSDYQQIVAQRSYFGDFDPFGDFDLLFGAAKLNLKIVELPVRYSARTYGETNINRWRHGWLLLRMALFAMRKLKFV
jgi:ubiquinone/menaquinone biosynthesis C-methylase UbiE